MDSRNAIVTYDEKGGIENVEDIDVYVQVKKRHFKKGEFYMVHQSLDKLILENGYTGLTVRVLIALKHRIDYNNRIRGFRQIEIAEQLKTSQANVSRSLKILENDRVIEKDNVDYYFNPNYIKGAGDNPDRKTKKTKKEPTLDEMEGQQCLKTP